jgi:hypothetical protein
MGTLNIARCMRLARQSIRRLDVDLGGLSVLTEAATGPFALTASLAAAAGAEQVVALARTSRHGTQAEAEAQTRSAAEAFGVAERLRIIHERTDSLIESCDVVTNLGALRPLDGEFLQRLKPTSAIALMFETWEFREQDVDLDACRNLGIPILGTNEDEIEIVAYLGPLAAKLMFECDIEVQGARLVLLGGGRFGAAILRAMINMGASVTQIVAAPAGRRLRTKLMDALAEADALIVAEHECRDIMIGDCGALPAGEIAEINPALAVIHIAGGVDRGDVERAGLRHAPKDFAAPGYMSVTPGYLGPKPIIDLHLAGLKVGSLLARARLQGKPASEAEALARSAWPLCQGFA